MKGKKNKNSWVLDTGATDHVNFFINNFVTFRRIEPIRISLPNGSHVIAYYDGTVALFEIFSYITYYIYHNLPLILFLCKNWLKIITVNSLLLLSFVIFKMRSH